MSGGCRWGESRAPCVNLSSDSAESLRFRGRMAAVQHGHDGGIFSFKEDLRSPDTSKCEFSQLLAAPPRPAFRPDTPAEVRAALTGNVPAASMDRPTESDLFPPAASVGLPGRGIPQDALGASVSQNATPVGTSPRLSLCRPFVSPCSGEAGGLFFQRLQARQETFIRISTRRAVWRGRDASHWEKNQMPIIPAPMTVTPRSIPRFFWRS